MERMSGRNNLQASACLALVEMLMVVCTFACSSKSSGRVSEASDQPRSNLEQRKEPVSPTEFGYPRLLDRSTWIVAERHRLLKTADGGKTWRVIYSIKTPTESENQVRGVSFVDAKVGFLIVAGRVYGGRLLSTTDGGQNWESVGEIKSVETRISFKNCYFADALHGWAVGLAWSPGFGGNEPRIPAYEGIVFATLDGGRTWRKQAVGLPKNDVAKGQKWGLNDVLFRDKDRGWIFGDAGLIFWTVDGGATWQLAAAADVDYQCATFLNEQFGWASYKYGNGSWGVAVTSDGGRRWRQLTESFVFGGWPAYAAFVTPEHGFAISLKLYETSDGGETWKLRGGSNTAEGYDYLGRARDGTMVTLSLNNGTIATLISIDDGATWLPNK
jgi:photosystem II stability/assembly factor-like uncharacterized protein